MNWFQIFNYIPEKIKKIKYLTPTSSAPNSIKLRIFSTHQKINQREFPSGLVVRILGFHCHDQGSIPRWETEIPLAMWCGQRKKKEVTQEKSQSIEADPEMTQIIELVYKVIKICSICSRR